MSKLGQGRPIRSQTQEVVFNVKRYFDQEKDSGGPVLLVTKVTRRVADATGIGLSRVQAICRSGEEARNAGSEFPKETPNKKRMRLFPVTKPDNFALEAIRRKIHSFYLCGRIPSMHRLLTTLEEDHTNSTAGTPPVFEGSVESLRLVVTKHLGFRFKKLDRRKHLLERTDVVAARHEYLRQLKTIDLTKDSVVFLDETWVNEHHSVPSCWQSHTEAGVKALSGKGKRLILLHAGTIDGFVPNCLLLFVSKSGLADYHDDMNAEVFTEWFETQLLPNIPPASTIVMDNASYHSVQLDKAPNSNTLKGDMQKWLTEQNVAFHPQMLKAELYELVKRYKPQRKRYVIDEMAKEHGFPVIRLPPYHCEFNPIELIWAQVKGQVGKNNKSFKMAEVKQLTEMAIEDVTKENWRKAVNHVQKTMDYYWTHDCIIENTLEPFIISVNDSDSDSGDDSEESCDSFDNSFHRIN